jgi:hypothetical protein
LERLIEAKLAPEHVLSALQRRSWYDAGTLANVEKGVRLYFENRHLEAIYVLVPQLEDMLRQGVRALGGATTAYRRHKGGVDEQPLERVLAHPLIERHIGRDYVIFAAHTLVDPRGENLRNEVGHGLLKSSADDRLLADLALLHVVLLGQPAESGKPDGGVAAV